MNNWIEYEVTLSERKIKLVLKQLEDILDAENIYGQTWCKQVIGALILSNLKKKTFEELVKDLEKVEDWHDGE